MLAENAVYALFDGLATRVGEAALEGVEILELCGDGQLLWLTTADGLVAWRGDVLAELEIDGQPAHGPVACGGQLAGEQIAWVADGELVHAVAARDNEFSVFVSEDMGGPVTGLATDGEGRPWAVVEEELWVRTDTDTWTQVKLEREAITAVLGGARASGVWALAPDPVFVPLDLESSALRPVEGPGFTTPPNSRWHTDGLGRLVVLDSVGLHRLSMDRPLWIEGIAVGDELTEATEVQVLATLPAEVERITVELPELDATFEADENGRALVDLAGLPPGGFTLLLRASYDDQGETVVEWPVSLSPAGGITWVDHVQPIHEASCVLCHANSAETILDGPSAWQGQIDNVLVQVESGAMPLGRPPLSAREVALIEAWEEGGFLP